MLHIFLFFYTYKCILGIFPLNTQTLSSFFLNFIEAELIYNVVLIYVAQQSDSVIYIYIFFFFTFISIMVYHRVLNIIPCAIQ